MGQIELRGLKFTAYHGYYDEERARGNQFEVDVILQVDFSEAARKDDLSGTVDYQDIYRIVSLHMQQPSRLLEYVVDKILRDIEDSFPSVRQAEVKLYKKNPPIGGECDAAIVSDRFSR